MAQGLIPGRGDWIIRQFTTTSAATFFPGCAVTLGVQTRTLSEYSGGATGFLGIAASYSTASLPATQVLVHIPNGPGCTMFVDVPTGVAASSLSQGDTVGLYKIGNLMSYLSTSYTSAGGRPLQIVGPLSSAFSRIECAVEYAAVLYGSAASQVLTTT